MSLKRKLYIGSIWQASSQFGSQGINFIVLIILARLLSPSDFGLVGMVTVITGFLGYFSEFGFIATLVQRKQIDELDCNTAFWGGVALSVFLYAIVFGIAPLVARFYNQVALTLITRIIFIEFLVRPFAFIHSALEIRVLRYSRLATAQLASLCVSGLIAIILAFLGFGFWSLVLQQLVRSLLEVVIVIKLVRWTPSLMFSFGRFQELLGSGIHFLAHNVLKFFAGNIDYLLVGKVLGPASLGVYTLAFRLSRYPLEKIWSIFGRLLFPAFSTLQGDLPKLRRNFMRLSLAGGLLLTPVAVILLFGVKSIIMVLLGEKWLGAVPLIRIFVAYVCFFGISFGDEPLMLATNKVRTTNLFNVLASVALLGAGYAATKSYGLVGMATVYTCTALTHIVILKRSVLRHLGLSMWEFLRNLKLVLLYIVTVFISTGLYAFCTVGKMGDVAYLVGEALVVVFVVIIFITRYRLVDFKKRELNIDAFTAVT